MAALEEWTTDEILVGQRAGIVSEGDTLRYAFTHWYMGDWPDEWLPSNVLGAFRRIASRYDDDGGAAA